MPPPPNLRIFAPAKINLYLHVTGRRDDGYHTLDSLVAFADCGDEITLAPSQDLKFTATGPFAGAFNKKELDASPHSANLAVHAAWSLARLVKKIPDVAITLEKNLPLGAGLGGGSADAAAIVWGMLEYWKLPQNLPDLPELLLSLGADVPVCLNCRTSRISGIGEKLAPGPDFPDIPIVLVYPGKPCNTAKIFGLFHGKHTHSLSLPPAFDDPESLADFLKHNTENQLLSAALSEVPDIHNVITALQAQDGNLLARMSGSGSSCFGIFGTENAAQKAAKTLAAENPDWWVRASWLGRPERY